MITKPGRGDCTPERLAAYGTQEVRAGRMQAVSFEVGRNEVAEIVTIMRSYPDVPYRVTAIGSLRWVYGGPPPAFDHEIDRRDWEAGKQ